LPEGLIKHIVGDRVHQSDFKSSDGCDFFRRDEKLQGSALPDQAWQALRASPAGHETQSGTTMSKDSIGSGDPTVTSEREIETSAHAVAFDHGDDRRWIADDRVHQRLSHGGELVSFGPGQWGDFIQVGTD
jgi:hypothetical protein